MKKLGNDFDYARCRVLTDHFYCIVNMADKNGIVASLRLTFSAEYAAR